MAMDKMKGGYEDIFAEDTGEGMGGGDEFAGMFEEDMMEENPDDLLMKSLMELDYDVTPDKLEKIKQILEGGTEDESVGMAPEGLEMTDTGAAEAM